MERAISTLSAGCCRTRTVSSPRLRLYSQLHRSQPAPFFSRSFVPPTRSPLRAGSPRTTGRLPLRSPSLSRFASTSNLEEAVYERRRKMYAAKNRSLFLYTTAVILVTVGVTYASVPLYRAFCSATGFGGTPMTTSTKFAAERLHAVRDARRITVHFNADTSDVLPWTFKPQQKFVRILPGETTLAFYRAKNDGPEDIIGIATYNVTPAKIAPYFAKVECFCFEEQRLAAGEEVDMPLFFFIDKDFADDPQMNDIDDVVLSYTFFKARRTSKGHLVPDAPQDVVEAASGFADYELAKQAHDDTVQ